MQLDIALSPALLRADEAEPDLIERAKKDPAAFATLYRQHYSIVARYILRRIGDTHTSEDLTAEVFLLALRYLPRYRQRGLPLRVWLYRIAIDVINRWIRRERWRNRLGEFFSRGLLASRGIESSATTVDAAELEADGARRALLTLPGRFQTALTLHYLEGMSLEEVAATVGCRLGTVKSRLSRGRDMLRETLERTARAEARHAGAAHKNELATASRRSAVAERPRK